MARESFGAPERRVLTPQLKELDYVHCLVDFKFELFFGKDMAPFSLANSHKLSARIFSKDQPSIPTDLMTTLGAGDWEEICLAMDDCLICARSGSGMMHRGKCGS